MEISIKIQAFWGMTPYQLIVNDVSEEIYVSVFRGEEV
jgi:hypothetical protein